MSDVFVRIKTEYENSGIAKADKALGGLLSTIGKGSIVLATFALAANKAFDFGQQGAQIARLEASGKSLAASYGANMSTMLSAMKKTAQGTVAETDLILSANRAMMLGVTADAEQMANLLEVAALRGRAMGLSTSQAFNDIVTGIGRMSPLILDNLGIVTNMESRVQEWAKANGVAASSVSDTTKKQILLQQVLEDGNKQLKEHGGLVFDTAAAYEKFGAQSTDAWNRVKKEFGEFIEPAVSGLADYLEVVNNTADAQEILNAEFVAGHDAGTGLVNMYRLSNGELVTAAELIEIANNAQREANHETERAAMLHGILFPQVAETGKAYLTAAQALEKFNSVNTNLNSTIDSMIEKMKLEAVGITEVEKQYEGLVANYLNSGMAIHSLEANLEGVRSAAIAAGVAAGTIGNDEAREQLALLGLSLEEINRLLQLVSGTYDIKLVLDLVGRFGVGGADAILSNNGRGGGGAGRSGLVKREHSGGPLNKGGWTLIGEGPSGNSPYAELVGPDGTVYPPDETKKKMALFKALGMAPVGMARGGQLPSPEPEGFQLSKGGGWLTFAGQQYAREGGGTYTNPASRMKVGTNAGHFVGGGPTIFGVQGGDVNAPRLNGGNGGSSDAANIQAAASQAAQAAASGVGSTAVAAAQNQSVQAIERASADAVRASQALERTLKLIYKDMLRRTDLSNEFADALAKVVS